MSSHASLSRVDRALRPYLYDQPLKEEKRSCDRKRSFCYHLLVPQDKEKEIGTLWNQVITVSPSIKEIEREGVSARANKLLFHNLSELKYKKKTKEKRRNTKSFFIFFWKMAFCLLFSLLFDYEP